MVLTENDSKTERKASFKTHYCSGGFSGGERDGAPFHTQREVDVCSRGVGWRSADGKLLRNSKAGGRWAKPMTIFLLKAGQSDQIWRVRYEEFGQIDPNGCSRILAKKKKAQSERGLRVA